MKYKTLFRLVLRLLGVYLIAQALVSGINQMVQLAVSLSQGGGGLRLVYLIPPAVGHLVKGAIGLYLFFGGKWIVNWAIPGNRPYCPECGYDLSGAVANRCTECGTPFRRQDVQPAKADAPPADVP